MLLNKKIEKLVLKFIPKSEKELFLNKAENEVKE